MPSPCAPPGPEQGLGFRVFLTKRELKSCAESSQSKEEAADNDEGVFAWTLRAQQTCLSRARAHRRRARTRRAERRTIMETTGSRQQGWRPPSRVLRGKSAKCSEVAVDSCSSAAASRRVLSSSSSKLLNSLCGSPQQHRAQAPQPYSMSAAGGRSAFARVTHKASCNAARAPCLAQEGPALLGSAFGISGHSESRAAQS